MNELLIRTPIFSLRNLKEFYNCKNSEVFIFKVFKENKIFKESIYLYSKVLYNQALKYSSYKENGTLCEKKKNKVADSLIKYFLRMCYRSTPFGLSAGISIAEFDYKNTNNININYQNRSVKIDSSVLYNILEEVNSLKIIRDNVFFYRNNTLYEKNGYYRYIERKKGKTSFEFNLERVEKTNFLEEILELSKTGIRSIDIINLLKDDEDLTEKDISEFIEELIDSQLIISELQYNVLDISYEKTFIKRIKQITDFDDSRNNDLTIIIECLDKVFELMESLKNQALDSGSALETIRKIDLLLMSYNETEKSAIQIDLTNVIDDTLSHEIKEDIKRYIPFFTKISHQINSENGDIENFKKAYVNQYGNKTTPILEVLDPDLGIGYPVKLTINSYSFFLDKINIKVKGTAERKFTRWNNFLLEKYESALIDKQRVIQISAKDSFFSNETIDVNDTVLFTGQVLKNKDNTLKYLFNSLKVGGAYFIAGRFAYGNKKIEKFCKDVSSIEKQNLQENQVYSDLLHLSHPKLGNVILRPNCYHYYISIIDATNKDIEHTIPLNDLYIAIDNNKIILYSKKLNKQVLPRLGCAQNTELLTSPIYKFLGAISDDYYINTWNWGFLSDRPYLPRVEFGKFILSKEKWLLHYKNIFNTNIKDIIVLNEYIQNNGISRYVTMSLGGDNLLPLDLHNTECLKILFKELKTKSNVVLEEDLYSQIEEVDTVFSNKNEKTTNEICIPININRGVNIKRSSINLNKINSQINLTNTLSEVKSFPFDKVLYVKIYPKSGIDVDNIFTNKLLLLISALKKDNLFHVFFFIRYIDPAYHFRLRFFTDKSNFNKIIDELNIMFNDEIKTLLIDKIQIDTYEREISRYGGTLGLEISEKIFYYDSLCVLQILSWIKHKEEHRNLWLIAIVGVHCLLNDFSIKTENRLIILKELRNFYFSAIMNTKEVNKNISLFYNENKKTIEDNMDLGYFETKYFIFFKERSSQNNALVCQLIENKIIYDVKNYIHMFLNRLFEFNQNMQETIIYDLLIRYYKSLFFKTIKQ